MSRDDFWINSPKDFWDIPSPQNTTNFDTDFDIGTGLGYTEIPNSPMIDINTPDFYFQPPASPLQIGSPQPIAEPVQPKTSFAPPLHGKHRRTPSMPVSAGPIIGLPSNLPSQLTDRNHNTTLAQPLAGQQMQPRVARAPPGAGLTPNHSRSGSMPEAGLNVEDSFAAICSDPNIKFNPANLGFIPSKIWANEDMTFGEIVSQFFQKKNNANSRFSHKLYNALRITDFDHFYYLFLGVEWVTDNILKVDKKQFARLLGIRTIDGSFFHQQGNFPSHGFVELDPKTAQAHLDPKVLEDVDYDNVRLLTHQEGIFVRGCTESVLESCKWVSTKKRGPA